jgi:hypothetical protein
MRIVAPHIAVGAAARFYYFFRGHSMTKTAYSFVWKLVVLTVLFSVSTSLSIAAPRGYTFQQSGFDSWGRPVGYWVRSRNMVPAAAMTPQAGAGYQAMISPSARMGGTIDGASDYMPNITEQGTFHWQTDKFPLKVWISDGAGVPSYRPQYGTFIRNGFDEWCRVSNGKLAWVEVADPSKADITVKWTNQVTERPEGTEAGKTDALTKLNTSTGQGIIYGARMQFLTRMPNREFTDLEVAKTCMHEVGHAMGLQGHSPNRHDIMYYAVQPTQEPVLSQRDVNTLTRLYANYPVLDAVALSAKQPQH